MVVALSTAGKDFEGGELEVRIPQGRVHSVADLARGDAVVFRGWDSHRVRALRAGRRRVIVAEWWLGPECSGEEPRPPDTEEVRALLYPPLPSFALLCPSLLPLRQNPTPKHRASRVALAEDNKLNKEVARRVRHIYYITYTIHHILYIICYILYSAEVARRALELDDTCAETHLILGEVLKDRADKRVVTLVYK